MRRRRLGYGKVAKRSLRKRESVVSRGMLRSTWARVDSMRLLYWTPEGQAVMQAMQPRHLSMWSRKF